MSCYNWESGKIKIPTKEWKRVRDSVVLAANDRNQRNYQAALTIWKALKDKTLIAKAKDLAKDYNVGKPKDKQIKLRSIKPRLLFDAANEQWGSSWALQKVIEGRHAFNVIRVPNKTVIRSGLFGSTEDRSVDWHDDFHAIRDALFPVEWVDGNRVEKGLRKPLAKQFPKLKPTKVDELRAREASVFFDHAKKAVTWRVDENNRAVEAAQETWLAKALFGALNRIPKWTRGSGGQIVGNDEYNREADYAGGGGNYVNHEYGPEVQKRKEKEAALYAKNSTYRRW